MSDIAKWALLLAGLIAIVAAVVALPIFDLLNIEQLTSAVSSITSTCSSAFIAARGLINYFFPAPVRPMVTIAIGYLFTRTFLIWGIKIISIVYKWIFK